MRASQTRREWLGLVAGLATLGSAGACTSAPPPTGLLEAEASNPWRGKPPNGGYLVNLRMRNPSAEVRWLVLPQMLSTREEATGNFVNERIISLALMDAKADTPGVILSSYADFWAFRAAPHAEIRFPALAIQSGFDVESAPESFVVELLVATELRVDDEPVEVEFPGLREPWPSGRVARPDTREPIEYWNQGEREGRVRVAIESVSRRRMKLPRWEF